MNPTTTTEAGAVADVAAKLTEAQTKVLRAGSASRFKDGAAILRHAKVRRWPSRPCYREFSHCWQYGEPGRWGVIRLRRLSPLAIAVRQHLEQGATAGVVGGKEA
jgi:hypothetical protein